MIKVPIVSCDMKKRALYFADTRLPRNYMEDFSRMGFVVDRYDDSIALLRLAGYFLETNRYSASLYIRNAMALQEVQSLLLSSSLYCEYGDIAETFYQA